MPPEFQHGLINMEIDYAELSRLPATLTKICENPFREHEQVQELELWAEDYSERSGEEIGKSGS